MSNPSLLPRQRNEDECLEKLPITIPTYKTKKTSPTSRQAREEVSLVSEGQLTKTVSFIELKISDYLSREQGLSNKGGRASC